MSTKTASVIEGLQGFGGPMTSAERAVVDRVKQLFDQVLDQGRGFDIVVHVILAALRRQLGVKRDPHGLCRSFDVGLPLEVLLKKVKKLPIGDHKLTSAERDFCRDALGAIRFAIVNGLSMAVLAAALCHDLREICDAGGMQKAIFVPKVSGWAWMSDDEVGSSEVD